MQDGPKPCFGWGGGQGERRSAEKHRDLGAQNGNDHLRDKIQRGDPREQTHEQEEAAEDL